MPMRGTFPAVCVSPAIGARTQLSARTTASPISRMGTFYEASAVKLQFRVIRHEQQRSDMLLAACLDIRPGRKAADDLLSVPTPWVGHPILCSLGGESRQTREEARPFSVAALSSGPVPLSSGSHQVAPSLRRSSASDRESRYAVLSLAPSGTTPNSRKRHSSINNFRARATIPTLRARVPPRPKRA